MVHIVQPPIISENPKFWVSREVTSVPSSGNFVSRGGLEILGDDKNYSADTNTDTSRRGGLHRRHTSGLGVACGYAGPESESGIRRFR